MIGRKISSILLSAVMLISLASGCASSGTPAASTSPAANSAAASSTDTPAAAPGEVFELRWGHVAAVDHPYHVALLEALAEVKEKTNGAVNVTIYPNSQLGSQREMTESVRDGVLDALCTTTATVSTFVPRAQVCDLPFLFKGREHANKVFDSPLRDEIFEGVDEAIGPVIAIWENGVRHLNSKKLIKTPADMKGLKMRVMESQAFIRMAECLGASATPMAYGELYTALQQGTVDMNDNITNSFVVGKLIEPAPFVTVTAHSYSATVICFSPYLEEKIGSENYQILVDVIRAYTDRERELSLLDEENGFKEIGNMGGTVYFPTEDELQMFSDACAPILDEFEEIVGAGLIGKIQAMA